MINIKTERFEPEHHEFEFLFLPSYGINHNEITEYSRWVSKNFSSFCKAGFTSELNSEWILRTYSATKMVMASTLLLNSAKHSIDNNNMVTVPYLLYYSLFNACRSLIYVSPMQTSKNLDDLITTTHSKVINVSSSIVSNLNKPLSKKLKELLLDLQYERELFSYKFPADGLRREINLDNVILLCGIVVEIAELTSRRIQHYIEKKFLSSEESRVIASNTWQVLDYNIISKLYQHEKKTVNNEKLFWIDDEDWYSVNYIRQKVKYPCSILFTMTEGMTEDFFGAWYDYDNEDDYNRFNPDHNKNIIFPIP
jgi:hypothetical protein